MMRAVRNAFLALLGFGAASCLAQSIQTTDFALPTAYHPYGPLHIAPGSDGNLWFTEGSGLKIGRITTSGNITEFPVASATNVLNNIVNGPDGNLWFTETGSNKIRRMSTAGVVSGEFSLPSKTQTVVAIATGPDGNLWFTVTDQGSGAIGRITPAGSITYPVVTIASNYQPAAIVAGPVADGAMWFTEYNASGSSVIGKVGRLTLAGAITNEFQMPTAPSNSTPLNDSMIVGPDGNLWFTEFELNIGRVTTSGVVTEFAAPGAVSIISGPPSDSGALWFTNGTTLIRITTAGVQTKFTLPPGSSPIGLTVGADANIWMAENYTNKIARSTVEPPLAITTACPAGGIGLLTGTSLSFSLTTTGGLAPLSWSPVAGLPAGITFNNGVFSGSTTASGTFPFTATVSDSSNGFSQTASFSCSLVAASSLYINSSCPSVQFVQNQSIGIYPFSAGGGTPTYHWSILSGAPTGIVINSAGVLSGTPTSTPGTYLTTIQVADSGPNNAAQTRTVSCSLDVARTSSTTLMSSASSSSLGAPVTLTAAITPTPASGSVLFTAGSLLIGTATVSNGAASLVTRLLPAGTLALRANYTGDVNHTPSVSSAVPISVTATSESYFSAATITTTSAPGTVITADFNGDGVVDLAVPNTGSNTVSIFLGNAAGPFSSSPSTTFGTISSPTTLVAGDFNGDGLLDLAVANASGSVQLYTGNGAGSFSSYIGTGFGSGIVSLASADFDANGVSDLAICVNNGSSSSLWIQKNSGPVTFVTSIPAGITAMSVGDFNGDGIPDLALTGASGSSGLVYLYAGDGTGSFSAISGSPVSTVGSPQTIRTADFNSDGRTDLAIANASGQITILLANSGGGVTPASGSPINVANANAAIAAADFNGDGRTDLYVVNQSNPGIAILQGNGDGTFGSPSSVFPTASTPTAIVAGEFNGDFRTDLLYTSTSANVTVLTSTTPNIQIESLSGTAQNSVVGTVFSAPLRAIVRDGSGAPVPGVTVTFLAPPATPSGRFGSFPNVAVQTDSSGIATSPAFTAGTVSGTYLVTASVSGAPAPASFTLTNLPGPPAQVSVTNGTPQSTFILTSFGGPLAALVSDSFGNPVPGITVTFTAPASGPSGILSGNGQAVSAGNGVASMPITANSITGSFTVTATYSNLSPASFSLTNNPVTTTSTTVSSSPASTSLSSSVTLTASVTPLGATGSVTFLAGTTVVGTAPLSNGTASLTTKLLPAGRYGLRAIYAGDLLHPASLSTAITQTVTATAETGFGVKYDYSTGTSPAAVVVADVNNDGYPDLIIANAGSNSVTVLLGSGQNGPTAFTPAAGSPYAVGGSPKALAIADFDKDGFPDVAVANSTGGTITILRGTSTGLTTGSTLTLSPSANPLAIVASDFDRDGSADLAVGTSNNVVQFVRGHGDGTFTFMGTTGVLLAVQPITAITAADWNNDGIPDLAVAGGTGVQTLTGNGVGSFSGAFSSSSAGPAPNSVSSLDYNNDGNLDLIVGSTGASPSITIFQGSGNGDFSNATTIPVSGGTGFFAVGDINAETTRDFFYGATGSLIADFSGNANAFSTAYSGAPGAMAAADLNLDHQTDLVVLNSSGIVSVYYGGRIPYVLTKTSGDGQNGGAKANFNSFQVTVKDTSGNPVPNAAVTFSAPVSGATGTFSGNSSATATSNSSGIATAPTFTANCTLGSFSVTATVPGAINASPVQFSEANIAGAPFAMTMLSGGGQSTMRNTAFTNPLSVSVLDSCSNAVPGAQVTFSGPGSGASLVFAGGSGAAVRTANTSGVATSPGIFANDIVGTYTVSLSSGSASAAVTLTNSPSFPSVLSGVSGGATAPAGQSLGTVTVKLTDTVGNALPNTTITFTAPGAGAGATFPGNTNVATVQTNTAGTAVSPVLTANSNAGLFKVTATGPASNTVSFNFTNTKTTTTTTLTVSPTPSALGQSITLHATIAPPLTGLVAFFDGTVQLGIAPLNSSSQATLATRLLPSGGQALRAAYLGNTTYGASYSSPVTQSVTSQPDIGLGALTSFPSGLSPNVGVIADFNNDGIPDIASASASAATVTLELGNGSGNFSQSTGSTVGVGGIPVSIVSADFNGDGISDLATVSASGVVSILLGDGNGGIASASGVSMQGLSVLSMVTADFNHDGKADLALGAQVNGMNEIFVLLGAGDGTFGGGGIVTAIPGSTTGLQSLVVQDLTGQGIPGLAFVSPSSNGTTPGQLYELLGEGDGTFGISTYSAGFQNAHIATGDFNNDGLQDLALSSGTTSSAGITVFFGDGTGLLTPAGTSTPVSGATGLISAADYNGDGKLDLLVPTQNGTIYGITLLQGNGSGGFSTFPILSSSGAAPAGILAADLNLDSHTDLVLIGLTGSGTLLGANLPAAIQSTSGTPQSAITGTAFATALKARVVDVNNTPIPGVAVSFVAPSTGPSGTFTGNTVINTDLTGVATAGAFTASCAPGNYTVTANVAGVTPSAAFSLTNLVGPAATVSVAGGSNQAAILGASFSTLLSVIVRDACGNPVPGALVTFIGPSSGPSATFSPSTVSTNSSGIAAVIATANNTPGGPYQVSASVSGAQTSATFSLTNISPLTMLSACPSGGVKAYQGSSFSLPLQVGGGIPGYSWSRGSTAVPGLTFTSGSGASASLSGTPTTPGTYPLSIQASDSSPQPQSVTYNCNLVVYPTLQITTLCPLLGGTAGVPYQTTLTGTGGGGSYRWSISTGTLPTGFSLDPVSGIISGTTSTYGNFPLTLQLNDGVGSPTATMSCSLSIDPPKLQITSTCPASPLLYGQSYSTPLSASGGIGTYFFSTSGNVPPGMGVNGSTFSGTPTAIDVYTFNIVVTSGSSTAVQGCTVAVRAPALQFTSGCPGDGTIGVPYPAFQLAATGGLGPATYTFSVVNGTLPVGLSLNGASISGTPKGPPGASSYQFQVTSGKDTLTGPVCNTRILPGTLSLTGVCPAGPFIAGSPVSFGFSVTGGTGPYTFSIAGPSWLSIATQGASANVTGTAPDAGSFPVTITVTDSAYSAPATLTCTVTVVLPPLQLSAVCPSGPLSLGSAFSLGLGASGGKAPYSWSLSGPSWMRLSASSGAAVTLSGTPTDAGPASFTVTLSDSANSKTTSFSCTVTVIVAPLTISGTCPAGPLTAGAPFSLTLAAMGGKPPYIWTASGAQLASSGNSATITAQPTAPGTLQFSVTLSDSAGTAPATFSCSIPVIPAPPTIHGTCPAGSLTAGAAFSLSLSATDGTAPYTWSLAGPSWMSLSNTTGLTTNVVGVPPDAGDFPFTVTLTDSAKNQATFNCSLHVIPALKLTGVCPASPSIVGAPFSLPLTATGGQPGYSWSLTGPSWLTLSANSGASVNAAGTPTDAGSFPFAVVLKDSLGNSANLNCTVVVNAPLSLVGTCPAALTAGSSSTSTYTGAGGVMPYSWTLSGPSWLAGTNVPTPSGLSFSVAASPTDPGQYPFTITLTDATNTSTKLSCTLVVNPAALSITGTCPASSVVAGAVFNLPLSASGGTPSFTWTLSGPSWLTLTATSGQSVSLTGTPPSAGTFPFTATVTDSAGATASFPCTLTVTPAPLRITGACAPSALDVPINLSTPLSATGGSGNYTWSISSPSWINVSSKSGTNINVVLSSPPQFGPFTYAVTLADDASSTPALLSCNSAINRPTFPSIVISGLTPTPNLTDPIQPVATLSGPAPLPMTGILRLSFVANAFGVTDNSQVVWNGRDASAAGRDFSFSLAATATSLPLPGLQQGTVAGNIHIELVSLSNGTNDITPAIHPAADLAIPRTAPVVGNTDVSFTNETGTGFDILISGFSTPRDIKSVTLTFNPATGAKIDTTSFTLDLSSIFTTYYSSAASKLVGSMFSNLDIPVTIDGDKTAIGSVTVTLTNSIGASQSVTKTR